MSDFNFNFDKFKFWDNLIAVHCRTKIQAKDFISCCDMHGIKWSYSSGMERTFWNVHGNKTVYIYTPKGLVYGAITEERMKNKKVVEWADFI